MNRVNIQEIQPEAYNAMFGLEAYIATSTIDNALQEMVRIRASLINGCQYCIGMHSEAASKQASKLGVNDEKIAELSNWKESGLFSAKEQAVFAVTDALTHVSVNGIPEDVYQNAADYFSKEEMAQLVMLISLINAWNRMGVSMAGYVVSESY